MDDWAASEASNDGQKAMRKSCRFCRTRKIKCTGDATGCKACRQRGIDCVYDPTATMGRPRKYPRTDAGHGTAPPSVAPTEAPATKSPALVPTAPMPSPPVTSTTQWSEGWPVEGPSSAAIWPGAPDNVNLYQDARRSATGLDLNPLAGASGWASTSTQPAFAQAAQVWAMPPAAAAGGALPAGRPGRAAWDPLAFATPQTISVGSNSTTSTDRPVTDAQIATLLTQSHYPLRRRNSDVLPVFPPSGAPMGIPTPLSPVPPQDAFSTTELASTFMAFRGKPIATMASAHLDFLTRDTPVGPPAGQPDFAGSTASDPAHTRRYYIAAFKSLASSHPAADETPESPVSQPDFSHWSVYAEMISDTIKLAAAGEGFPMPETNRSRFAAMLRHDRGGTFEPSSPGHEPSPLAGLSVDQCLQVFGLWHSRSPLGFLINDAFFATQVSQGLADQALVAAVAGWVLSSTAELGPRAEEIPPEIRDLDPHRLFDFAEKELLQREVSIDRPARLLGTVQGLVVLATFRAHTLQARKCWALFSVAHGLARASVRRSQAAELDARRRGATRAVPGDLRVIEENLLSCCWLMAILAAWCFLSSNMPKTSVLDMCDGLPALPTSIRHSVSYQARAASSSCRLSDEPVAFGIDFFSESTRVVGVITRLWSRGVSMAPEPGEPPAEPDRPMVSIWRKRLYGDPRVKQIGIVGPIIADMLAREAREMWTPSPSDPQPAPRSLMILPVAQSALALTQLVPKVSDGRSTSSSVGTRALIHALGVMVEIALVVVGAAGAPLSAPSIADVNLSAVRSSVIVRICAFAFPKAIALLKDAVDSASTSQDQYTVVSELNAEVRRIAEGIRTLASTDHGLVGHNELVATDHVVSAVTSLFPQVPTSPISGPRSASVPPQFEGASRPATPTPTTNPLLVRKLSTSGAHQPTGRPNDIESILFGRGNLVLQPVFSTLSGFAAHTGASPSLSSGLGAGT